MADGVDSRLHHLGVDAISSEDVAKRIIENVCSFSVSDNSDLLTG